MQVKARRVKPSFMGYSVPSLNPEQMIWAFTCSQALQGYGSARLFFANTQFYNFAPLR